MIRLAVVVVLAAVLCPAASSTVVMSHASGVLFFSVDDGLEGIRSTPRTAVFAMQVGGTRARQLTRYRVGGVSDPAATRDGTTLAFAHQSKVEIYDVRHGSRRVVLDETGATRFACVDWSPGSSTLAAGTTDGRIFVVTRSGAIRRILQLGVLRVTAVSWSPDGRSLLFGADTDTDPDTDSAAVYVTPAARPEPRRLTPFVEGVGDTRWSPDGRRILYLQASYFHARDRGLWLARADGSHRRRLYRLDLAPDGAAWSPDGQQIVYLGDAQVAALPVASHFTFVTPAGEPVRSVRVRVGARRYGIDWAAGA